MNDFERKPEWLASLVKLLAGELGISETEIRQRPGFDLIHDSLTAVEFVMELEEELK